MAAAIAAGDRRALARGVTLIESTRADHRRDAEALIAELTPRAGAAVRIGVTGPPGVGKSTFIEALGLHVIGAGRRPAVLAIDPSSPVTGGSILGDKTRMQELARDERAFIRPSPAGGALGGVARRTREAGILCEAAGFDVVLIETVGVGQSETAVAGMVDVFVLLLPPGGGDELQGIKKGVVELADLVVVNKADGDLAAAAARAAAEYQSALRMLRPAGDETHVLKISALHAEGLDAAWSEIVAFRDRLGPAGLAAKRAAQARGWMWTEIDDGLRDALRGDPALAAMLAASERDVADGKLAAPEAARRILAAFRKGP